MCGRYALTTPPEIVADAFDTDISRIGSWAERYNVAPTQDVTVVRIRDSARQAELMRWGLIPNWARDPGIGSRMINARAETVRSKFKRAFARRRCIIPADGFYEWQRIDDRTKQPMLIRTADEAVFGMAGIWEYWRPDDMEEGILSCSIITTTPNEIMEPIHDRMPVILDASEYEPWLASEQDEDALHALLDPFPADQMITIPVSKHVNSPDNDDARCFDPVEPERGLF